MILLAKAERADFLQVATVNVADLTKELFVKAQALAERDWQLDSVAKGQIVVRPSKNYRSHDESGPECHSAY